MKITFFFPDWSGLRSVSTLGEVPHVGDEVYASSHRFELPEGQEYNNFGPWKVLKVSYSLDIETDWESAIKLVAKDIPVTQYRAEVMLGKAKQYFKKKEKNG